jgi:Asp-tRNA(Asn)/Glu-tRNA(Gln) amidotransferase A subunit family amidase
MTDFDRRRFVALLSTLSVGAAGAAALPESLAEAATAAHQKAARSKKKKKTAAPAAAPAKPGEITGATVAAFETLSGLSFTPEHRALMLKGLAGQRDDYAKLRKLPLANDVAPALRFDPTPPATAGFAPPPRAEFRLSAPSAAGAPAVPAALDSSELERLAFLPATAWGRLLRERRVTSVALTRMYLARLRKHDPLLHAVITLTEERALAAAERADREIASGRWRGPLHGVPYGAKDLLAARGYRTTWGSVPFKDQMIDLDATVIERLDEAGAVLVAKTAVGELAWGDVWFGGTTANPWKPDQGSSGSSAGSAAATSAGLVGFSLGTETLGSIVSPCTRTGSTGLRPTFGRVSRHGAMALSWSMDKIGVIARSVEDCAAAFHVIHGPDGRDATVSDHPFDWDPDFDVKRLRVGYPRALFEADPPKGQEEWHAFDLASLAALRQLGVEPRPIELPALPADALRIILNAEAAAAFDELTVSGRSDLLVRQIEIAWPNIFRVGETIPAVSYIQAQRVRALLMTEMAKLFADLDAYVVPTYGGANLLITNLTGHPAVVAPNGFRKDGTPTSITFQGNLWGEAPLLALARAYQEATGFHRKQPPAVAVA